ncbi:MarR family winged helix-turn-helix transcriptional regulator [Kribbella kalugense]|uniref:DNA-binding MarR family transcriptional regulator n=1 Tax=Kribbella kalugense TaxID=2512221 RepID=A0A4R7ZKU5_9ACTN|nr:MarR family transcriptional regulator [Kribbella kalugense]TDW18413.1 DNA-binding MarR family transcriptional regulator [Kribbella kalugense]
MPEFLELHSKTSKLLRAAADAAVQRHGLRLGQDHLLAALWAEDGRTPGEIAASVNVTTPAVTKLATRLAEAGWLERRPDPRDNRLVRLWLTPAGRALQKPIETERQTLEDRVTATLTKTERAQLLKALTKINQVLLDGP